MRRGLAPSRERAQAAIASGRVLVGGAPADKAARLVAAGEPVEVLGPPPPFVSRGGQKLEAAMERFAVPVAGRRALDAGASTGGFTDCLLQRGAAHVVAVDVGHGQLDLRFRSHPRVAVLERTNVRHLTVEAVGGRVPLVVADLSFVSLRSVASSLVGLAAAGADLVVLVKPQFEAGPVEASRGRGVIRDPDIWTAAIQGVRAAFETEGAVMMGLMVSPLLGTEGNVEFLAHLGNGRTRSERAVDVDGVVAEGGVLQARRVGTGG